MIRRLAQAAVRKIVQAQVKESYRRAQILHTIFNEESPSIPSDMIPADLVEPLRAMTLRGEANGLASIPLLSETLSNI